MCWEFASLVPWIYQGLLFHPQCNPQVFCSQWSPLDFTPFSFFLGEICGGCSLENPWIFGTPLQQIEKYFSGSSFCFQRQKRGARENIWCFGGFGWFLQLRALCKHSLQYFSRIWCSRCVLDFVSFSLNPSLSRFRIEQRWSRVNETRH